ncbi:hypothetical protein J1G42_02865 [Cellulomonas sp. zg-ZUI222]|uniref:hypothetical protein n=1 Tax=Cellulomonas wangleii TaxID=2816956 RepID=UPI001A93DCD2|nr:hypothetical protein [Cellulomonas wangleii]MBO0919766.1 hypothetical protein [Cellulomonas wangleii]
MAPAPGYDPGAADALRASRLRTLAERIETVVDPALNAARTELWECANADDVRERLAAYQGAARAAARHLLQEASSADNDARRKRDAAAVTGAY